MSVGQPTGSNLFVNTITLGCSVYLYIIYTLYRSANKILVAESGVTYVRWGRTLCPGDSEKVYTGMV